MYKYTLWDRHGFQPEVQLEQLSDTQLTRELGGEYTFSFNISIKEWSYPLLSYRKIIRVHDPTINVVTSNITASTPTTITITKTAGIKLGDFVLVNEGHFFSTATSPTAASISSKENLESELNMTDTAAGPGLATEVTYNNLSGIGFANAISSTDNQWVKITENRSRRDIKTLISEVTQISNVSGTSFTCDLANAYHVGARIDYPIRSYVAQILSYVDNGSTLTLRLSRKDFTFTKNANVQLVDFQTFRITDINEDNNGGQYSASVTCNHITNDLTDTTFIHQGRTDFGASPRSINFSIGDSINLPNLLSLITERDVDTSNAPLRPNSFIPGSLIRQYHSKGQVTATGTDITGINTSWSNISSGALLDIEDDSTTYVVKNCHSTQQKLTMTSNVTSTSEPKNYRLRERFYSNITNLFGTCSTTNESKELTVIVGFNVEDVWHGARVKLADDNNIYIVNYVNQDGDLVLTENVKHRTATKVPIEISIFRIPYNIDSTRKRLGVLKNVVDSFNNDREHYHFVVNEDRSIDIFLKPEPDPRDPTSDMIIRPDQNLVRLSKGQIHQDFSNVIIPHGASSGWLNAESGISTQVQGNIIGVSGEASAAASGYDDNSTTNRPFYMQDTGRDFPGSLERGIILNVTQNTWATITSAIGDTITFDAGLKPNADWNSGDPEFNNTFFNDNDNYIVREPEHLNDPNKDFISLGVIPGMSVISTDYSYPPNTVSAIITSVSQTEITFVGSGVNIASFVPYTIDVGNNVNQVKLVKGQIKKFRFGDPLTIFHDKYNFIVNETTQLTLSRGLTGTSDNTSGEDETLIDNSKDFTSETVSHEGPIIPGMLVTKTNTSLVQRGYITDVTSATSLTCSALENEGEFSLNDTYRITLVAQFNYSYNKSSNSVFTDFGEECFRADNNEIYDSYILPNSDEDLEVDDAFYFGSTVKFGTISVDYIQLSETSGFQHKWTLAWEYYNGTIWQPLEFIVNQLLNFAPEEHTETGVYIAEFILPSDWSTLKLNTISSSGLDETGGLSVDSYWIRARVDTIQTLDNQVPPQIISADTILAQYFSKAPKARTINHREWADNRFSGGMCYITDGIGKNQMRRVVSNTVDELVFAHPWAPTPQSEIGFLAQGFVAQKVTNTFVRGFGYKQFNFDSSYTNIPNLIASPSMPTVEHAYRNGILVVKKGIGQGQRFKIGSNKLGLLADRNQEGEFYVDGRFNPMPKQATIEISALHQRCESFATGTIYVEGSSNYMQVSLSLGHHLSHHVSIDPSLDYDTKIWNGGTLFITGGTYSGYSYTITESKHTGVDDNGDSIMQFGVSSWASRKPSNGDSAMLIQETDLHMTFADAIDFVPTDGDEIVMLLKETGGPLTIGKSEQHRTTVVDATETYMEIQNGAGSKFERGQLIFVGTRQVSSDISFNIDRGDQAIGTQYTIKNVIKGTHTSSTSSHIVLVDETKNFSLLGVRLGMRVTHQGLRVSSDVISIGTSINENDTLGVLLDISVGAYHPGDEYVIEAIFPNETMTVVPQPGDHIEVIGFQDNLSAHELSNVEQVMTYSNVNDPNILYDRGLSDLTKKKTILSRYEVGLVDRRLLEPATYPYMNYELGDTVTIIDPPITPKSGTTLRVLREDFDTQRPADKARTLHLDKSPRRFIEDTIIGLTLDQRDTANTLDKLQRIIDTPICMWWNGRQKQCTRIAPPNIFCESKESNTDGRFTKELLPIDQVKHCQSYTPLVARRIGAESARIQVIKDSLTDVANDEWDTTHRFPINVPFVLATESYCEILDAGLPNNSDGSRDKVECRIQVNDIGNIIPYQSSGIALGLGGWCQVRRSNSDINTYNVEVSVIAIGHDL